MEIVLFYITAAIALLSTLMTITRLNAVHALVYLIMSLLSIAVIFYLLGAPFAAALEVIVYAGAIMVLFVFVIMMLNLGARTVEQEQQWLSKTFWIGPAILATVLFVEVFFLINQSQLKVKGSIVSAKEVGMSLFGPYMLIVELAAMLLLAGLIGAYHLARNDPSHDDSIDQEESS